MCRRSQAIRRFELVATSSRSGQGVGADFTDWRELIRTVEGLEAVAITTPPGPRYEIARECVLAGLHCLLEKPPTAGLAEIADLDCLAQAKQVSSVHDLACAASFDRRSGGEGACRQAHQVDARSAGTRTSTNGIRASSGSGSRAASACSTPASTPSRSRPGSFPAACSSSRPTFSVPAECADADRRRHHFYSPEADGPLTASLDWRRTEGEEWTITVETSDGIEVRLEDGGAKLSSTAKPSIDNGIGEYPDIYRTFVDLIDERRSLVDVAPLRLVADCLLVGGRRIVDADHHVDGATWAAGHCYRRGRGRNEPGRAIAGTIARGTGDDRRT